MKLGELTLATLLADGTADTVASYLEAFGTISAVVLALFLQVVLVRLRRPRLEVVMSERDEDQDRVLIDHLAGRAEYWIRLRVRAAGRKEGATGVQVQLLRAVRPVRGGVVVPTGPFSWSNLGAGNGIFAASIPPGTWRRFDVIQVRWQVDGTGQNVVIPMLDLANPIDAQILLGDPGKYDLEFVLAADNIDATFWRLTFVLAKDAALDKEGLKSVLTGFKLAQLVSGEPGSDVKSVVFPSEGRRRGRGST